MEDKAEQLAKLLARGEHEMQIRDVVGALASFRTLIASGDDRAYIRFMEGEALCALNEFAQAHAAYERGLDLDPAQPALHINAARALLHLGEADRAVAHLETAVRLGRGRQALERLAIIAPGAPSCSLERVRDIRRQFGEVLAASAPDWEIPEMRMEPGAPLQVAYISAHFDRPAYLGPVWGLINQHDRARVAIHLMADAPVAGAFSGYENHPEDVLVDVSEFNDLEIVNYIRSRKIDLLVDLSGYSHPKRLSLYARPPAPRVATWFNMYATSGLPGVDYIIGDDAVVRPDEEHCYTEQVLRLPLSYLSFQGWNDRPAPSAPPCISGDVFTFGSLVSMYKLTPPLLDTWAEILRAAPRARLLLGNSCLDPVDNRAWLLERFAERGIDAARIELRGSAPHAEFLRYYDGIDVALDAFPYSGGTTTMEALWQGVPVLTQCGDRWAARTSASLLMDTHLREFCRQDPMDYVQFAVHLATDPAVPVQLAHLRREMRAQLRESRVMNGAALARAMEACYEEICRRPRVLSVS